MRYVAFAGWIALVLAQAGCSGGGTVTVPCEAARCNESCIASGDASGECRFEMCECRPRLDLPSGPTAGLSSGGAVARSSAGYQMELTIGPVAPAAERASATQDVELGLQPQADPARRQAP